MAELGEHVYLSTEENGRNLVYVDRYFCRKSILITRSNKHICVYDVNDPRPLNSWTTGSGQTVQHGAIVDHSTKECLAIINHQTIRRWGTEDAALNKGKKFTVSKPAYRLVSHAPFQPVILYMDGTIAWLNKANEMIGQPLVKPVEKILWTETVVIGSGLILVILKTDEEKSEQSCYVYDIPADLNEIKQTKLEVTGDLSACSKCLRVSGSRATLLLMNHSTGALCETIIHGPSFGQTKTLGCVPMGSYRNSAICSLGPTHLAVCGVLSENEACLGIWDTKFGILQAWKPFTDAASNENLQVQLLCLTGHLIVCSRNGICAFPYKSKQSSLGAALGKFNSPAFKIKEELRPSLLQENLDQLVDQKKTGTKKNFRQALNFFLNEWANAKTQDMLSVQGHMVAVIERLMSDPDLCLREDVQALIKHSLIPMSVCTTFMRSLIAKKDILLLHECICHLQDISEAGLVECLSFFLNSDESKFSEVTDEEMSEGCTDELHVPCPFSKTKAAFIGKVLSLPYNDVFLVGHLKQVDFQKCMELLQYLHYLLETMPVGNMEQSACKLSIIQVVDWINLVLDVHFTQLVLSVEARQILVSLHQSVEKNVQFYDELVGLENILSQIKEKCALPQKQNPGLYNIHVLHVF